LKSIYHCDLKGLNIVYDYDGKIKFIDFGSIVFDFKKYGKYGYTE
jgi:serine/threonine protein kinase